MKIDAYIVGFPVSGKMLYTVLPYSPPPESAFVLVERRELEFEPLTIDPRLLEVKYLKNEIEKERAESEKRVTDLQGQINKLLAIDMESSNVG